MPDRSRGARDHRFRAAFGFAFQGVLHAVRTQRNMRVHLVAATLALLATLYLRLDRAYVALVVLSIALVLALELLNTAVEAIVDLVSPAPHPLAKIAKDTAAGAVLVAAIGAAVVGYVAFYEGVTAAGASVAAAVASVPRNAAIATLAVAAVLTVFGKAYAGPGAPPHGGAVSGRAALAFAAATLVALGGATVVAALLAYFIAFLAAQSRVEAGTDGVRRALAGAGLGTVTAWGVFALAHAR